MKKSAKSFVLFIILLPVLVGGLIFGAGQHYARQFQEQQYSAEMICAPVSFRNFPMDRSAGGASGGAGRLAIWVENTPSMAGYVSYNERIDCPDSFLEYMMDPAQPVTGWFSGVTSASLYRFNTTFAQRLADASEAQQRTVLDEMSFTGTQSVLRQGFFQSQSEVTPAQGGTTGRHALASVLSNLDTSIPNLIVTDFLETSAAVTSGELQAACGRLFRSNLTIQVVALDGYFSGALYDAGEDGQYLAFCVEGNNEFSSSGSRTVRQRFESGGSIEAQVVGPRSYPAHRHTRPLYVVVVGTAEQCGEIVSTILEQYQAYSNALDYSTPHLHSGMSGIREASVFSFGRLGVLQVLSKGDETEIVSRMAQADGPYDLTIHETDYNQQPLHANGVSAYRLIKDGHSVSQVYTIEYSFMPDVESYQTNWSMDVYQAGPLQKSRFVFGPEGTLEGPTGSVAVIGSQTLSYALESYQDATGAISLGACRPGENGVTVQIRIDASLLPTGYYRLALPVMLERDVESNLDDLQRLEIQSWSARRDSPSEAAFGTTDLYDQMQAISDAQLEYLHEPVLVAAITLDLEIAE